MINKWIEKTIIGLELCPFTRRPFLEGKILIEELPGKTSIEAQPYFLNSLNLFQNQNKYETVLQVYPDWKTSFKVFYDFLEDCEDLLISLKLEDEFQLVAFHPQFCFHGLDFSNRANLVNSSPLPLIHILRINDLEVLNLSAQDAEAMSFGNATKLERMSHEQIIDHFPWRQLLN